MSEAYITRIAKFLPNESVSNEEMEEYFGMKVNMKLWVKVKEDWRNNENAIMDFGLKFD